MGLKTEIDNLTFAYSRNRLASVTDGSQIYMGYPDVFGGTMGYDGNGNMTDHTDKGILEIRYNLLNLPHYIRFNESVGRIIRRYVNTAYTYRADGVKLMKMHSYKATPTAASLSWTRTDYIDDFQYETSSASPSGTAVLKFVPTAEGYYDFEKNRYIYSYTDHLGNIRLSYFRNGNNSAEVLEENNFYPFGLKQEGYNQTAGNSSYNYGYNNKELQKETGWNDYGWRQYIPELGRWNGMDQLSEAYSSFSPYAYVANNPVNSTDPDGRKIINNDQQAMEAEYRAWFSGGGGGGFASYFGGGGSGFSSEMNAYFGNTGSGWGTTAGPATFGGTAAYGALMSGQTSGITNSNRYLNWNTLDNANPNGMLDNGSIGGMTAHSMKINETDWYGPAGKGNWFFSAGAALSGIKGTLNSERMYTSGVRRGLSGNYQLKGRNLSLFGKMPPTEASMPTSSLAKWAGIAGKASFGIGVAMDGLGVYNYYNNPNSVNKVHPAKAGLNTAIGAYGLTGAGTIPALLYFGVDAFYPGGWEGYGNDYQSLQMQNAAIVPGFITAPYGSQKF